MMEMDLIKVMLVFINTIVVLGLRLVEILMGQRQRILVANLFLYLLTD